MMYLERNREVVRELSAQKLHLKKYPPVGNSKFTTFSPVGEWYSQTLSAHIPLGIKENSVTDDLSYRLSCELAVIATIAETFPHLVPELPAFYALLKYQKSHARLIITEDFSCGGTLSVSPLTAEVPREIRDIRYMFPSWGIPLFELEKMCFLVNNTKRRLGDFDPLGSVGSSNVLPLVDVIFKAPKPHTVSVQSLT